MKTTMTWVALAASAALAQSQTTETPATAGKTGTDKTNEAECAECVDMPPYVGSAAFEKMKALVGKWSATSEEMGEMNTEFRVIAGGAVIEERFAAGTPMEMLSLYHDVDGKLTMTHYCVMRNQPRMNLVKSTGDSLTFDLAPTPGLDPQKDTHMHGATYTFIDADHFKLEGVAWKDGKESPCGPPVVYTRQ
ncbi:hypothetical protein [Luteolibacter marinus]|uniref:hypothetical protein n=1 Tax=Luteolibacter marinus TaxID=2776705 RepID=UPI0018660518|nr:hypothetical protein [Luteolibacter marinus]